MTIYEYAEMVELMREAQRQYFRQRTPAALRTAIGLEVKVDNASKGIRDRLIPMEETVPQ